MATVSKRQQARNERDLQDLLRLPGNTACADCGARNPGWASWNLGVFLCMRCASLHRKMGTHISKVKSLSMDTWTSEQVDNMKRNGNVAVNKIYNPKNKKPDIPLDADEVDSAMERYIRKKYQDKSLGNGRPQPPSQSEYSPPVPPKSPEQSPPRTLPSKKGRFFGFGLRASSSTLPLSKHDKKKLPPQPRVDETFTIGGDDLGSISRTSDARAPMPESQLSKKLDQLRDMGFNDGDRNLTVLRRTQGDVGRAIEILVQLGPSPGQRTSSAKVTPQPTGTSRTSVTAAGTSDSVQSAARFSNISNNPFDQVSSGQSFGISLTPSQQQQPSGGFNSNNPFDQQSWSQTDSGLAGAFQGLQVSQQQQAQPLFPNSTGGFPSQPPPLMANRMQSMTPPAPSMNQQYGYVASRSAFDQNPNPFFQSMQPQATGSNPFFSQSQQVPLQQTHNVALTNPFIGATNEQQSPSSSTFNPFGLPPGPSPPQSSQGRPGARPMANQAAGISPAATGNPFQQYMMAQPFAQSQSPPSQLPNFQYGQPQMPQQEQQTGQSQASQNPYGGLSQIQHHHQPQAGQFPQAPNPYAQFSPIQSHGAQLMPQQTGRHDKNSILALYNYPQLAPSKPQRLSSIPEPENDSSHLQAPAFQARRSATMPLAMSSMHSAGGAGNLGANRNPFLQNTASMSANYQSTAPAGGGPGVTRHISQDSVSINNLESGRHSPDAFANLSARFA